MATLAAILVVVAYHMSEWRSFRAELTAPKSDVVVLLVTFLLTVLVDLTVAIEVGMVAAAFLFMRRMAEVANVSSLTIELEDDGDQYSSDPNAVSRRSVPPGIEVFEVNGPFFFGVAEAFKDTIGQIAKKPRVLIIRLRNVPSIDSSGMHALKDVVHRSRKEGTMVFLSDVHTQPLIAISRSAVLEEIGEQNLFGNLDDALDRAREYIGLPHGARPPGTTPTVARETPRASRTAR
jgi:SulP family sulfate permease